MLESLAVKYSQFRNHDHLRHAVHLLPPPQTMLFSESHVCSARQFRAETIEKPAPACFDNLGAIGPIDVGSLMCAHEIGAFLAWQELEGDQRCGDALLVEVHC